MTNIKMKQMNKMHPVHYHWLDLIRFLAALAVVLVHTRGEVWETYSLLAPESRTPFTMILYSALTLGYAGVIVFFVLSGFLVGGRNLGRVVEGTADIRKYVIDRSVRIGLPLIGSIVLIIIVDLILGTPSDFVKIAGNLVALQGIFVGDAGGVFWTLSYEIWFYVLIAGCIMLFSKKKHIPKGVVAIFISLCAFTVLHTFLLLVLASGIISYYLLKTRNRKSNVLLFGSICLFGVALVMNMLASDSKAFNKSIFKFINFDLSAFLMGIGAALFISEIVRRVPTKGISRWFDRMGSRLAVFSYSLYLTHWQVLRIVNHYFGRSTVIDGNAFAKFTVTVLTCIVFAYLFYLITERNTDRVKRWFAKK